MTKANLLYIKSTILTNVVCVVFLHWERRLNAVVFKLQIQRFKEEYTLNDLEKMNGRPIRYSQRDRI